MEDMLAWGRRILASQPFSVLLGAKLLAFQEGSVAGGSALGPSVVTSEFKINYLRPAMGEYIVARATVIHAGKNQAVCRCDVYVSSNHNESLCATAQGTIARLSQPPESRA
jgi:uncharacterized protein (TIGR00369 family)